MARYFLIAAVLVATSVLVAEPAATAPATAPSADAFPLFDKAAKIINARWHDRQLCSPSSSNSSFPTYPPFGDDWLNMEKSNFGADAMVRDLVHQANSMDRADWPPFIFDTAKAQNDLTYLGECRSVANDLRDGAAYQSIYLNDQPSAFQTLNDTQHIAELLQDQPGLVLVRELAADGIVAINAYTSNIIVSRISITSDPANHHDLPVATARAWIARLIDHPSAEARLDTVMDSEFSVAKMQNSPFKTKAEFLASPTLASVWPHYREMFRRVTAERDLAAMSLAAHLYFFQHQRWPANFQDLATELPKVPIDPFGDGKQTLGYVLIPNGLPDGNDRPLVYSRSESHDGMFYRLDRPEYGYYIAPNELQKHGGQFRDVARWAPATNTPAEDPTTRPLVP